MIDSMKRRSLKRNIESLNQILTDPRKSDGQARAEAILLLGRICPIGSTATKAAKNAINNPASLAGSANPRKRGGQMIQMSTSGLTLHVNPLVYDKIKDFMRAGQKIQAIKELRLATSCGLKEAKDVIEGDRSLVAVTKTTSLRR